MPATDFKSRVRDRFSAAAASYDAVAGAQREIAQTLAHSLHDAPAPSRWLDAGCGTGYASALLAPRWPDAQAFALDAAVGMCARHPSAGRAVIGGDIEALPLATGTLDLYWSSLAWQWTCSERAAREAFRVLRPGGRLCVATLGPRTLLELREAFAEVDTHPHIRSFEPPEQALAALSAAGFADIRLQRADTCFHAADLRGLLAILRELGASELGESRRRGLLGRHAWQRLNQACEARRSAAGLPGRYDVLYLNARRPCP